MAEFVGRKLILALRLLTMDVAFSCLWHKMMRCRALTMLRGKLMRIHRESYSSRSHNVTFYRI
jgi:hypothetical protein